MATVFSRISVIRIQWRFLKHLRVTYLLYRPRRKIDYARAFFSVKESSYAPPSHLSIQRWHRGAPSRLWRDAFDWPTWEFRALCGLGRWEEGPPACPGAGD